MYYYVGVYSFNVLCVLDCLVAFFSSFLFVLVTSDLFFLMYEFNNECKLFGTSSAII